MKREHTFIAALFFILSLILVRAQMSCEPPPSGLVSWWAGDGNADDIVGGNNGILTNGVTFGTGEVGQAFNFNGTNQEIVVSNAANLNLDQAFTIEAWVNFADVNSSHTILCKGVSGYHQYALLTGDLGPNHELELLVESQGVYDGYSELITSQAHLTSNTWYHVAATADGSTKSIYLDGQLLASNSAAAPYNSNSQPVEIGAADLGSVAFFNGLIDEVSVYNRALSQTEIQAIYNAGSAGKCKPGIPEITTITTENTNVVINFLTASNYVYGIEARTDLVLGSWNTIVSNISGAVGTTNYTDVGGATIPQKFYRAFHY